MKDNRREFLKKAALLSGGIGIWSVLPPALKKALAINPEMDSTFYDAEHVVFLMQENRSFDHCFGTLQGVRGYNDPRAIDLPSLNNVFLQENRMGETFHPFRLNMKDSKATWMGGLPHSWENQVDARNDGKYDQWLVAKQPGNKDFQSMPLTLGYYNREDIPFYYAFADAFTVCDQHFCSSLTGTTSNRMFFWTGAIKDKPGAPAWVRNSDIGYGREVTWKTFPERLEENGISWKVYQNELSITTDLSGEDESLLSNFTNNNLEWFSQYNVRFSSGHYQYLLKQVPLLKKKVETLELLVRDGKASDEESKELTETKKRLFTTQKEAARWSPENFKKLSVFEQNLHKKGLSINTEDLDYHKTEVVDYKDKNGIDRSINVPKGDIFHEFRKDVNTGNLPTVSWLVAPKYFSDHPSAPWYGAWYVSETLDILTKNPEIWKKTIFILNYDENDGYFDHVPPFVAPNPLDINSGKVSEGIDSSDEFVTIKEELDKGVNPDNARQSAVGLGYRVPLIIASPWSRGGWVNSEVCDISSTLIFLEKFLNKKFGKNIKEENISSWRRAISGDLTSAFRPYHGEEIHFPKPIERNAFMKEIHDARFKKLPSGFKALTPKEIEDFNENPKKSPYLPRQEIGIRNANALPYEHYIEEHLNRETGAFELKFIASDRQFGKQAKGTAFSVYAPKKYWQENAEGKQELLPVKTWDMAVEVSKTVEYQWPLAKFENQEYNLRVYGPNGFYKEYRGDTNSFLMVETNYLISADKKEVLLEVTIKNTHPSRSTTFQLDNMIYGQKFFNGKLKALEEKTMKIPAHSSFNWYDISISEIGDSRFFRKLAGHIATGLPSKTDPLMGGEVGKIFN